MWLVLWSWRDGHRHRAFILASFLDATYIPSTMLIKVKASLIFQFPITHVFLLRNYPDTDGKRGVYPHICPKGLSKRVPLTITLSLVIRSSSILTLTTRCFPTIRESRMRCVELTGAVADHPNQGESGGTIRRAAPATAIDFRRATNVCNGSSRLTSCALHFIADLGSCEYIGRMTRQRRTLISQQDPYCIWFWPCVADVNIYSGCSS